MNNANRFSSILVAMIICLAASAVADEVKLPPGATVLDPDIMMYSWPYPIISPDGESVAYISKGFVCICNVAGPEPRRVFEVPHTWTHFLAQPENAHAKGVFHEATGKTREERNATMAKITHTVFGLQWAHDSQSVVFGVRSYDKQQKNALYDLWRVPLRGVVELLTDIKRDISYGIGTDFRVTRDGRFLVTPRPLIWDLATNKPRATCFYNLTPSSTSGRWIGIEKDTWQLVITDDNFEITKRFDIVQAARHGGPKLNWSPDERYLIWRNKIGFDHYSNWEGFWMDLETGEKRELSGQFMSQQFEFTGREGEYVCWGARGEKNKGFSGAHSTGAYLTLVTDPMNSAKDIWQTKQPLRAPLVRLGPKYQLFAVGVPRPLPTKIHGYVWHLFDRSGKKWQFPGDDTGEYYSPYKVVGFANGGKTIIAYDTNRLFALPVKTVMNGMQ